MLAIVQFSCFGMREFKAKVNGQTQTVAKMADTPQINLLISIPEDFLIDKVIKEYCVPQESVLKKCKTLLALRQTCKVLKKRCTIGDLGRWLDKVKEAETYFNQIPSTIIKKKSNIDAVAKVDYTGGYCPSRPSCISLKDHFYYAKILYRKKDCAQELRTKQLLVLELLENDENSASNYYITNMLQPAIAANEPDFALDLVKARPASLIYRKKIEQLIQDYLENKVRVFDYQSSEEKATFARNLRNCL